jgi:uncharacterized protein (DUF2336 family)
MSTETAVTSSGLVLSEADVLALLDQSKSDAVVAITAKIADTYAAQSLKPTDTVASEQIFRLLIKDTELKIRVALAEHVKRSTQLPKDIVMAMARDVHEVALPILQHSQVLTDDDLLELISSTQEIKRYLAVSRRKSVSLAISDTLISKRSDAVAVTLVSNPGADISGDGLEAIVEQFPSNEWLMRAISDRPHLPAAVIEKMIDKVSASFAETLKEKFQIPTKALEGEFDKTRESETLKLLRMTHDQEEVSKLVTQMQTFNRLTPSLILSALCQGNFCFFETSLAKLSNIPVANARSLINDRGELGFRAIYNKSGLSESMFPAVKMLLRVVHELAEQGGDPAVAGYADKIVERILEYSKTHSVDNVSYIIALVRQAAQ